METESSERKVVDGLGALAFGGGNKKENNKSEKMLVRKKYLFIYTVWIWVIPLYLLRTE